jgi:hypothetical protein
MNLIYLSIIILTTIIVCIIFLIGYIIGKISSINGVSTAKGINKNINKEIGFAENNIDDTKFVVKIKTDQLQKKYDELGEMKSSQEDISDSISKLKSMKG